MGKNRFKQRSHAPTPSEIEARAAEIRSRWTSSEEHRRRVQKGEPLVLVPLDGRSIGLTAELSEVAT